ncbi:hypothetical protein BX616_010127 [Lobosporangium transversale]|uniref:G-protein coupled receptors family 2 profile 2 domain-containing protein n=1 Tax=Lobosporangium transversale TaxID=64571 RepID=A0A1Y2G5R1_9FUNG|nr:hypothetical protein BCR41DRAFT_365016 [Lobosporangium transversale]KAF9913229.1 hypothetical protein BX616_010127 [Lobosporangium transversale]ORY95992.1 hypothetical protein BCR41DRAFT_365016 [Lobosporangium transversale]|eukprot:XP_021875429.1 hypothetical protein BCR41DRAFT_365016 [Lobosporangium transversale]
MVRLLKSLTAGSILALAILLSATAAAPDTSTAGKPTAANPTSVSTKAAVVPSATTHFSLPTGTPTGTNNPPAGAGNQTMSRCPGPLIPNTMMLDIATCMGPCCIKCPAIESFYEPNTVENVLHAAYITRQVSLVFAVFMAISYLVLPGKRSQPHISVLFLTISLSLWYAAFDVMPGVSNACINDFEQSTAKNSRMCGIQGVLIIYLTQTCALWCSLLIYKLHMLAVWRSNWIDAYYGWFTGLCWTLPLAFAIPVAVKNLAEYPGIGFSCLVSTANLNTYLFYPTAVYIYPAMLCHIVTVGKMIHLAMMSSKIDPGLSQLSSDARMRITSTMQAKRLLRGQWRPALMLCTTMVSLTVFWLFYFVDAHRLSGLSRETPWLREWIRCIFLNGSQSRSSDETQTICARAAAHNLPSIPWFTAAELVLAIIGIVVAVVFITKAEFWEEWAYLLNNLIRRGKTGNNTASSRGTSPDMDAKNSSRAYMNHPPADDNEHPTISRMDNKVPAVHASEIFRNRGDKAELNEGPNSQWYDMDDLLDKEYDDHGNRTLQRSMSYGSQTGMAIHSGPNPVSEPPRYNSNMSSGDLLYRPPVHEAIPTHWSPSTPSRAYMTPNEGERYIEQPVLPTPVPRTPKLSSSEAVLQPPPPSSPMFKQGGSLSPMPPRSPTQTYTSSRAQLTESVPIVGVATRGVPSQAYQQQQQSSYPPSPSSQKTRAKVYSSNESSEQIMVASRTGVSSKSNPNMHINTVAANNDMAVQSDPRARSPLPPSVPTKNPHRQPLHSGQLSPSIRSPSSPTY